MAAKIDTVRFRVPVSLDLATAIERLATSLDRPTAWLAVELLKIAVEDRKRFADWIVLGFVGDAYKIIRRVAGRKPAKSSSLEVRLELNVPLDLVDAITELAHQWENRTPVQAAGMLLASAVHHNEPYIEMVSTRLVKSAIQIGRGAKGRTVEPKEMPLA